MSGPSAAPRAHHLPPCASQGPAPITHKAGMFLCDPGEELMVQEMTAQGQGECQGCSRCKPALPAAGSPRDGLHSPPRGPPALPSPIPGDPRPACSHPEARLPCLHPNPASPTTPRGLLPHACVLSETSQGPGSEPGLCLRPLHWASAHSPAQAHPPPPFTRVRPLLPTPTHHRGAHACTCTRVHAECEDNLLVPLISRTTAGLELGRAGWPGGRPLSEARPLPPHPLDSHVQQEALHGCLPLC